MTDWKKIEGFPNYSVCEDGRIRNDRRKRLLAGSLDTDGYNQVGLSKYGKVYMKTRHRLVAIAFVPNPNNLPEVNHIDEIKINCHKDNLEWCTPGHNKRHSVSIHCILIDPNGVEHKVHGIAKFCRENNLPRSSIQRLVNNQYKSMQYKGWTLKH